MSITSLLYGQFVLVSATCARRCKRLLNDTLPNLIRQRQNISSAKTSDRKKRERVGLSISKSTSSDRKNANKNEVLFIARNISLKN